jgi:hypothetical protein
VSPEVFYAETGEKLAIVLRATAKVSVTQFFSEDQDSLQIGLIATNKNRGIPTHRHLEFPRNLLKTAEFVLVRAGACKVKLQMFKEDQPIVIELNVGDGILLLDGIHGFDSLSEELQLLEIKQGPYAGNLDKEYL